MDGIVIFEKREIPKALASLQERGIDHDADQRGESIIWIHEEANLAPALKFLRHLGIRAVRKPWW